MINYHGVRAKKISLGMSILLGWLSRLIGAFCRAIVEYSFIYLKLCALFLLSHTPYDEDNRCFFNCKLLEACTLFINDQVLLKLLRGNLFVCLFFLSFC